MRLDGKLNFCLPWTNLYMKYKHMKNVYQISDKKKGKKDIG